MNGWMGVTIGDRMQALSATGEILGTLPQRVFRNIGMDGEFAVALGNSWFEVRRLSDPAAFPVETDFEGASSTIYSDTILLEGDVALFGRTIINEITWDLYRELFSVSVADPLAPVGIAWPSVSKFINWNDAELIDGYLYSRLSQKQQLDIYEVTDPAAPVTVGEFNPAHYSDGFIAGCGELLFLGGDVAVEIWSLADPAAPAYLGETPADNCRCLLPVDDLLYWGDAKGLHVLDVGDPAAPVEIGSLGEGLGTVHELGIKDNLIYAVGDAPVSLHGRSLCVVDVFDPANPLLLASTPTYFQLESFCLGEGAAYATDPDWGIVVFDICSSVVPAVKGVVNVMDIWAFGCAPGALMSVAGDGYDLFWTIPRDILDEIVVPLYLSHFNVDVAPNGARLSWRVATDAEAADFRLVARVPGAPARAVQFALSPEGLFTATDPAAAPGETVTYVLYRTGANGWELLGERSLEMPMLRVSLDAPVPNPFNPKTRLSFTLDRDQQAELAVYDVSGRKVRTLLSGPCSAGRTDIEWNGCGEGGRSLASGVYFARLTSEGSTLTRKMIC